MSYTSTTNGLRKPLEDWSQINWRKISKMVKNLRGRIFRARKLGNFKTLRNLQKLIQRNYANLLLSVRRITQTNKGKLTAGIDKEIINTPAQRVILVNTWKGGNFKPTRRVEIPKPNGKKRPLGIPTVRDRIEQAIIKNSLEPEWEALFEPNSYGFRPGRSCQDAIAQDFIRLRNGVDTWVLEADIQGFFDKIDHKFLMQSVQLPKAAKQGVFRAIKAGVRGEFPSSKSGTPQGGVISPLLANLVLHGLENVGHEVRLKIRNGGRYIDTINGFRYADDVVFILKPGDDSKLLREYIDNFLETRGLKVKEAKTKVAHSTDGFDFLGWNFAVKPNGKFISTPSQKATDSIKTKVKEVMKDSRFTLEHRINKCGSMIRGWRNYHRFCDMSQHDLWALRYWLWKFIRKQGRYNRYETNKVIKRAIPSVSWSACKFVIVKGDKSPYDGDFVYWSKRENANYDGITARLLKKQNHKCTDCNLSFISGDIAELHHIDGNHDNWKLLNLEVLHRECHQHQTIHGRVRVRTAG